MSEKNNDSKKTYCPKLNAACSYMISHCEEFKNFYNTYYDLKREDITPINLHNSLKTQFDFLIGKKKCKFDKLSPKGFEIMPTIDITFLDCEVLAKMLVIFNNFCRENDDTVYYRMSSINGNKDCSLMAYIIKNIIPDEIKGLDKLRETLQRSEYPNVPKEKEYLCLLNIIYDAGKQTLLWNNNCHKKKNLYKRCCEEVKFYKSELIDNTGEIPMEFFLKCYPQFGKLESIYYTWMYIDLCCRSILQYVIQGIIKNKKNTDKLTSIKKINGKILKIIEETSISEVKLKGTPEENLFSIFSYYFIRDKFLLDTSKLNYIKIQYDREEILAPEYSLNNFYSEKKIWSWKEIQILFEEGEKNDIKTFKSNLAKCFLLINRLNRNGRNIPITPMSLKALYRGIYLDKIKNKTTNKDNDLKSMTIMNEFLKKGIITSYDYYFIDEIINRGFYREQGLLEEFYAKNELQENLYYLVCLVLTRLNSDDMLNEFEMVLAAITETIGEIHSIYKIYETDDSSFFERTIIEEIVPSNNCKITTEMLTELYPHLEYLLGIGDSEEFYHISSI